MLSRQSAASPVILDMRPRKHVWVDFVVGCWRNMLSRPAHRGRQEKSGSAAKAWHPARIAVVFIPPTRSPVGSRLNGCGSPDLPFFHFFLVNPEHRLLYFSYPP